jgi:hypothetical protein
MNTMSRVASVVLLSALAATPPSADETAPQSRRITVVGTGSVSAPPDAVSFQAGATLVARTAGEALAANNATMARVKAELSAAQIAERDVQTLRFDVSPQYGNRPSESEEAPLIGYQVSHVLGVKLRDLDALGPLLDRLVEAGANTLYDVRFLVAEPDALVSEARALAVQDGIRKAAALSDAAGVKLGALASIVEGGADEPVPPMIRSGMAMGAIAAPVAAGEQEYRATVILTFGIE